MIFHVWKRRSMKTRASPIFELLVFLFLLHLVSSSSLRSRKERGKARLAKSARLQNMCHSESYVTIQEPTHERRVETRACTQRTAATAHPRRSSGNQKLPEHAQWQARPAVPADGSHEPGVRQVSRRSRAKLSYFQNRSYSQGVFEVQKSGPGSIPLRRSPIGLFQLLNIVQRSSIQRN